MLRHSEAAKRPRFLKTSLKGPWWTCVKGRSNFRGRRGGSTPVTASQPAVIERLPIVLRVPVHDRVRLQVVSVSHGSNKRRSSLMLQGALDTWLWLIFPTGAALLGFALFGAAQAWSRWSKDRETTSHASSLPAQVRHARSRGAVRRYLPGQARRQSKRHTRPEVLDQLDACVRPAQQLHEPNVPALEPVGPQLPLPVPLPVMQRVEVAHAVRPQDHALPIEHE